MYDMRPLSASLGTIVTGKPGELFKLDRDEMKKLLKNSGSILFRGYGPSVEDFENFTKLFGDNFLVHHGLGRIIISEDGTTQSAAPGSDEIPAHIERGYAPPIPTLVFFYCIRPAVRGGETTLFDGAALFERLSDRAQRFFASTRMRWKLRVGPELWQRALQAESQEEALPLIQFYFSSLTRKELGEEARCAFDGNELVVDFLTPCTVPTVRGNRVAFANSGISYLHSWTKDKEISLRMEDGSEFPLEHIQEAMTKSNDVVVPVKWNAGDILAIDNETVLHGRFAFDDPERKILTRICANEPAMA